MSVDKFLSMKPEIKSSIYNITSKLGGSFSAEHGIGLKLNIKFYNWNGTGNKGTI